MCGLFGISLNDTISDELINHAIDSLNTLEHRGPDQSGSFCDKKVFLGHRRLSILDLSDSGKQPMESNNVFITVNGEIYNYAYLREQLISFGYVFKSSSDSEVILHGYIHWGIDELLSRVDGMYAGIIYDRSKNKIYGFRDRVGIKPLYYYLDNNIFAWSSEIKAIKHYLPFERLSYDSEALLDFLTYRYIPSPKSAYKNLYKLEPASRFIFDIQSRQLRTQKYWHLDMDSISVSNPKQVMENVQNLVRESVQSQLVSDVPLGILLSGGIDSSIITQSASLSSANLSSFSIGFLDSPNDESTIASTMALKANTKHHLRYFDPGNFDSIISNMIKWFDEPFADTSAIPTENVCQYASQHVTVALTGDGGDEIFGGYKWYNSINSEAKSKRKFLKLQMHNLAKAFLSKESSCCSNFVQSYSSLRKGLAPTALNKWKRFLNVDKEYDTLWAYKKYYVPGYSPRKTAQYIDFHTYLPDDVLTKVDRVSMLHSIECRPPFLDQKIIEFAFKLPENFLYMNSHLKGGLKASFENYLPQEVLHHKKQGFGIQGANWRKKVLTNQNTIQEQILSEFLS